MEVVNETDKLTINSNDTNDTRTEADDTLLASKSIKNAEDPGEDSKVPSTTDDNSDNNAKPFKVADIEKYLDEIYTAKLEGNKKYTKGMFFAKHTAGKTLLCEACANYAEALQLCNQLDTDLNGETIESEELQSRYTELRTSIFLNLAVAGLKLESYDSAMNSCEAALKIDPTNVKALYRKAQILLETDQVEKAKQELLALVKLHPKNKQARSLLKQVCDDIKKRDDAEAFRVATERGLKAKKEAEESKQKNDAAKIPSLSTGESNSSKRESTLPELLENATLLNETKNGAILQDYAWGQSLTEVHLYLKIPNHCKAKDVKCEFHRKSVFLSIASERRPRFDKVETTRFITVDECTWQLESTGLLHICLFKEPVLGELATQQGHEWWKSVFVDHPEINPDLCSVGTNLAELPEAQRRKMDKAMWEERNMSQEEKDQRRLVEQEMADAEERRKASEEIAKKDPNKRRLMEMMQKQFPDIPVELR